ncbi:hypothetical protein SBA2_40073 [Acidobacteriia bacterium SbA2]|nr:hypothetical protein SBA2_40073 [Acidobacteriia bacterium SbA2]
MPFVLAVLYEMLSNTPGRAALDRTAEGGCPYMGVLIHDRGAIAAAG